MEVNHHGMYDTANQPIWQVILNEILHFDGVARRSWRQQMHWPDNEHNSVFSMGVFLYGYFPARVNGICLTAFHPACIYVKLDESFMN